MAVGVTVKLSGWAETKKLLDTASQEIQRNIIKKSLRKTAALVRDIAKATTAFRDRTGNLREGIQVRSVKNKSAVIEIDVVCTSPHAHLIENGWMQKTANGTRQIPASPFLAPALYQNEDVILKDIESNIQDYLAKLKAK
jgi:hypothetical protein